jgi:hypothetical protein
MAQAIVSGGSALALALLGNPSAVAAWMSAGIIVALFAERCVAGVRAAVRFRDPAGLLFAAVHLVRDVSWTAAIASWVVRRLRGRVSRPGHSMHPRTARPTHN